MTLRERFGTLAGLRLAYVGDGNNVCHSLMRIAGRFGMEFVAATPPGYEPNPDFSAAAAEDAEASGGSVTIVTDPREAARGAHAVYTDVWTSMGQDEDRERRLRDLEPYRVDAMLLALADPEGVARTASPRTSARRSTRTSSTAPAASRGSRRRIVCTRRRRSWRS